MDSWTPPPPPPCSPTPNGLTCIWHLDYCGHPIVTTLLKSQSYPYEGGWGKWSSGRKTSQSREDNQQAQPTYMYDIESRNQTSATMVEGECSVTILLTEFEVRTVSYGLSFSPLIYGPSAKCAGHKSTGKK